ncbi:MAG: VOC family protein [Candidatus Devosia phytovorans]|uniref:VOC family protein n=1 Tax=Candidatus Devosia phytovorans TaxID=3121372 RepID=A0AAJ5VUN3_9HYPH|nr:VOC family protein [Devosia sp.]WEK05186.1 MAG: VOC family protein [Devosia sp.]
MGKIHEIVFDCDKPAKLAQFWAGVLDGYAVRDYDDAEIARLAALGLTPDTDPTVMVDGPGPSICFQNVEGRRHDNNRVHFDIEVTDRMGEVERLKQAGAEPVRVLPTYTVMRDPEGNQFCLVDAMVEAAAIEVAA